jgi:glycosyltransferase involved in cell wall biosynthesis
MTDQIRASVGILTLNSKDDLPRALKSVAAFSDKFICDGNSTDGTQDVARSLGARVTKQVETEEPMQRITDFGVARTTCVNKSLEQWHFRLDSDEFLSPEAVEEIRAIVANPNPPYRIYKIPRKYIWRGQIIDDTITYPNRQIRFFRRDAIGGYTKMTHERVVINPGEPVGVMKHVMYVPMFDTYEDFDGKRLKRALDWDERHYRNSITQRKWAYAVVHTCAQLALFTLRFLRVRLISRGNKLPVSYELWRFKYLILTTWLATRVMVSKLLGRVQNVSV